MEKFWIDSRNTEKVKNDTSMLDTDRKEREVLRMIPELLVY